MSSSAAEAIRLLQAGRLAEAEAVARAMLARARDADVLHVLGCIRFEAGAADEAVRLLDEAISRDGGNASFAMNRARVLAALGRREEAAADLRRAVRLAPSLAAAWGQLGLAEMALRRPAEAQAAFREACALSPRDAACRGNLGVALQAQGKPAEACREFAAALEIDPGLADALVNWGNALEQLGDLDAARAKYLAAQRVAPGSPHPWLNAASNAAELGLREEARAGYLRALELQPASAEAQYGLGLLDLREQRFAPGWSAFERRFDTSPPQAVARGPRLPRFVRGAGAARPRVAVWLEQGIGDQVLFSTLLPELRADADAVVEVNARLVQAYRRSVEGLEFVATSEARHAFTRCSAQVPVGSLPSLYRPDRSSFSRQPRALLRADPARVAAMRAQLGAGRWIGIAWRSVQSGLRGGLASRKSIPLEHFARLADAWNARLLDLQYGDVGDERAAFEAAHPGMLARIEGLDTFGDLDGVLAAIEACEQVVTSSNATAHLAGALGKRARVVFLRARAPFHYWNAVDGARSLWYPSLEVATDVRWLDWRQAFEALAAAP